MKKKNLDIKINNRLIKIILLFKLILAQKNNLNYKNEIQRNNT